jgi:hypothetical protein
MNQDAFLEVTDRIREERPLLQEALFHHATKDHHEDRKDDAP